MDTFAVISCPGGVICPILRRPHRDSYAAASQVCERTETVKASTPTTASATGTFETILYEALADGEASISTYCELLKECGLTDI